MRPHRVEYAHLQCAGDAADALRERDWMIEYLPLVRRVARNFASQASAVLAREDMEQIGLIGLLEALRRYGRPDDRFADFAVMRIRGAILDELRRQDWRPRRARQGAHRLRNAERRLRQRLGRDPERAEVCRALRITVAEYERAQCDDCAEQFVSFDQLLAGGLELAGDRAGPEVRVIDQIRLARALETLDAREQRVIQLYYQFDLSLAEIAQVLALTAARICQINKRALAKLRAALQHD